MAKKFVGAMALLALASGCNSSAQSIDDHWNSSSVPPRIARAVLGYDAERDLQDRDDTNKGLSMTLRRHFLNDNPQNPSKDEAILTALTRRVDEIVNGATDRD